LTILFRQEGREDKRVTWRSGSFASPLRVQSWAGISPQFLQRQHSFYWSFSLHLCHKSQSKEQGLCLLPGLQGTNPWQLWRHELGMELAEDGKLEPMITTGVAGIGAA